MARVGNRVSALLLAAIMATMLMSLMGASAAFADDKPIYGISLNLDLNQINLNSKLTEGEVRARANGALSLDAQTEGVSLVGFDGIEKFDWETSQWSTIENDNTDVVAPGPIYYGVYTVKPNSGYIWPGEIANEHYRTRFNPSGGFRLYVNDTRCTKAFFACATDSTLKLWIPIDYNISNDSAEISRNAFTYNGKAQFPQVESVALGAGLELQADYYDVTYTDKNGNKITPINAGKYFVRIAAKGAVSEYGPESYGAISKEFTIEKAANTLSAKGKTAKVKYSKLKKKNRKLSVSKVIKFKNKGQGQLSYKKKKGNKKISINGKTDKVTVKKGLEKKTYNVKALVRAAGNGNYKAAENVVTFKVKVV